MSTYLAALSGFEKVYLACAVLGGGLFLMRAILMLLGADQGDSDIDAGHVGDLHAPDMDAHDIDAHDVDAHDAGVHDGGMDADLKLLTFQGITAFTMMFGLSGFAISRSTLLAVPAVLVLGFGFGLFAMWMVAKAFKMMGRLESSGTLDMYNALGEKGTVYLSIPPGGTGKVRITISERLKVFDAISNSREKLKTGDSIVVEDITAEGPLVVRKL